MLFLEATGGNMWLSIIILTLAIRFLLYKNSASTLNMQKDMGGGNMQKDMQRIQEQYADDPQQQAKEMMKMMKWGGGPLKGCKAMLFQLPVFLWLYGVISNFASHGAELTRKPRLSFDLPYKEQLYSFFHGVVDEAYLLTDFSEDIVQTTFLWIDLLANHHLLIAILTGILMAWQIYLTSSLRPQKSPAKLPNGQQMPDMQKMMKFMMVFMVIMMSSFAYSVPAGIGLYLITTTIFGFGQALYSNKTLLKAKWKARFGDKQQGEIIDEGESK